MKAKIQLGLTKQCRPFFKAAVFSKEGFGLQHNYHDPAEREFCGKSCLLVNKRRSLPRIGVRTTVSDSGVIEAKALCSGIAPRAKSYKEK